MNRIFGRRAGRQLRRLLRIYWKSPDAQVSALLYALAVALELGSVYGNVLAAQAEGRLLDTLQSKVSGAFVQAVLIFVAVSLTLLCVSTFRIYVRQAVEIRWRYGLTAYYLERWIDPRAYGQALLHHKELDNPDQRIAEDVRDFVASALGLSLSLVSACAALASFGGLLWVLSRDWPLRLDDTELHIPGFMMWVAIGYALLATWITHRMGRRLVPINFDRLRLEADFRYGLVRFRDSVEAVAFARAEGFERAGSLARFRAVLANAWQLIRAQRNLTLLTSGIGSMNGLIPVLVAAPAFFAGRLTLGSVIQTRIAYGQVSGSLTWLVNAYQEIARWRASIERLAVFANVTFSTDRELEAEPRIHVETGPDRGLGLSDLRICTPDRRILLEGLDMSVSPGERVSISGPSGVGKTTLLRTVAGLWPFGSGRVLVPDSVRMQFVTQRSYLPIASLRAAMSHPDPVGKYSDERIREVLAELELESLGKGLDDVQQWDHQLTDYEQQRLALARILLLEPEWILLDEATTTLDLAREEHFYAMLAERLPRSVVISIAYSPGMARYHTRHWELIPNDGAPATLRDHRDPSAFIPS